MRSRGPIEQITPSLWRGRAHEAWSPSQRARAVDEFLWCCEQVGDAELNVVETGIALGLHLATRAPSKMGGATPMHLAMRRGGGAALSMLIAAGGLLEEPDKNGDRPLACASWAGHAKAAAELLAAGAEVDGRDPAGWTPLMRACNGGWDECVLLLMRAGASLEAKDAQGRTPRTIAAGQGGEVEEMVEQEAARRESIALDAAAELASRSQGPRRAEKGLARSRSRAVSRSARVIIQHA